jgi:hypothetical protein
MLIPTMCGGKQGMSLFIVEQDQSTAAKNCSAAAQPVHEE